VRELILTRPLPLAETIQSASRIPECRYRRYQALRAPSPRLHRVQTDGAEFSRRSYVTVIPLIPRVLLGHIFIVEQIRFNPA